MQGRADIIKLTLPAGGRQGSVEAGDAAVCDQTDIALTHFHAIGLFTRKPGNVLRLAIDGDLTECYFRRGVQSPVPRKRAADFIFHGESVAGKIQPQVFFQAELVRFRLRVAAFDHLPLQRLAAAHAVGGKLFPVIG